MFSLKAYRNDTAGKNNEDSCFEQKERVLLILGVIYMKYLRAYSHQAKGKPSENNQERSKNERQIKQTNLDFTSFFYSA